MQPSANRTAGKSECSQAQIGLQANRNAAKRKSDCRQIGMQPSANRTVGKSECSQAQIGLQANRTAAKQTGLQANWTAAKCRLDCRQIRHSSSFIDLNTLRQ